MCVCVHVSVSPVFSYTPQEWEAVSGRAGIQLINQSIPDLLSASRGTIAAIERISGPTCKVIV